ncbi:calmodulin-interacting protein 111 [Iris pallida]|uniref:Calmodulin-interacting protein 111 n=1 Tax=Iris pallida TaxID=29817 RepID=A0AAX6E4B8_IRIPA|nr:calmodulin-interacting protein 111 [Iris pallida]
MPKKKPPPPRPDRSPLPRTPSSSPKPKAGSASGPEPESGEALLRSLLPEASARFPALIAGNAFVGRVSEKDPDLSRGNRARVWLSDSAMVASSIAPGSLVTVSLAASAEKLPSSFPLDSLTKECASHFGIDVDDTMSNGAGSYFVIATVLPSRKLLKNAVRLSWSLSCTMGFPATGRAVFVFPIGSLFPSNHSNKTGNGTNVFLHKYTDIYLNLVPPKVGGEGSFANGTLRETVSVPVRNEIAGSPKTPPYQSKLSSPGATPLRSGSEDLISAPNSSKCLDVSAVRSALADEKASELLQASAARWLYGQYLLKGNVVSIPLIFGQICAFQVQGADKLSTGSCGQNLICEGKLSHEIQVFDPLDEVDIAHVDTRTKVHLSDPMSLIAETPNKERLVAGNTMYKATMDKEASYIPRLGGLSKQFTALKEIIMFTLTSKGHLPRYKGVLLHGPPGTGKTSLASYCAHDAGASLFSINGPEIVSEYYGESEQRLLEIFESAKRAAPAVIFIDELDAIAPTRKDGGEELSLRLVATLLKLMDEISKNDRILVIAATNRPDSIDPAMRRPGRLDREIEIGVPSPEQRLDILHILLRRINHSLNATDLQSLASATHGFVGADLAALCNEAAMVALHRHIKSTRRHCEDPRSKVDGFDAAVQNSEVQRTMDALSGNHMDSLMLSLSELTVSSRPICPINLEKVPEGDDTSLDMLSRNDEGEDLLVTAEDFEKAKMKVRPSAMREVMLELPKVRWEDVGGQKKVKEQLKEAVEWPQLHPDSFKRIGVRPPRGLLMIGPPGCSKTLMARAVASEAKLNFLAVKGPELFSKWVGESEKAVRSLFAKARANSPAIIFFDEIDGLAVTRGGENDCISVGDRVLSQLLVEMDGLEQRAGVTVIAATNRPDKIDPALLRPGRFDRLLSVQLPDETDREDIFRIHVRNMPCSNDVSIKDLARLTNGYTGADIRLICREAALAAIEESFEITEVSMKHFEIGISRVRPTDVRFYLELAKQYLRTV